MVQKTPATLSLKKMVERLVQEYQPHKLFLFGSYAYGQPDEQSDLDLLVLKDTTGESWREIFRGWRLQRTHDLELLLDEAIKYDPGMEQYRGTCLTVTRYNVEDRYPQDRRELTLEEVASSLAQIQSLCHRIVDTSERGN